MADDFIQSSPTEPGITEPGITEHRYTADDGAELGYLRRGSGALLVCLPGGPGADVRYLAGLGGLDGHRTLLLVDQRATGRSPVPEDRSGCVYTAQAQDLEALRRALGVEQLDLLAHSAAALTAQEYAAAHPGGGPAADPGDTGRAGRQGAR